MKLKIPVSLIPLSLMICFLGGCDSFDRSLEDYASQVLGIGYDFHSPVVSRPDGSLAIPPASEEPVSDFTVKLRNPRTYRLISEMDTGGSTGITYTQEDPTHVCIQIQNAAWHAVYALKLMPHTADGQRDFDPYILPVIKCLSFNTNLASLMVSGGGILTFGGFNPAVKSYRVEVGNAVESINLQGMPQISGATVSGNGWKTLRVGDNRFILTVRAENGVSTGEYAVTVYRKPVAGVTITLNGMPMDVFPEDTMILTQPLIRAENTSLVITINGSFDSYVLFALCHSEPIMPVSVQTLTVTATQFSVGIHWINCKVTKNGIPYSKTFVIRVQ